jgi:hypothetical protein
MKQVRREPSREEVAGQMAVFGDVAVVVANGLAAILALALALSLGLSTYGRLLGASSPEQVGGVSARVAALTEGAGLTGAIARGVVMLVLFGIAIALMRSAHADWRTRLGRGFSWFYLALSGGLLIAGVLLFHAYAYSFRDYAMLVAGVLMFAVFAMIMVGVAGADAFLPYFGAIFVIPALLNIVLFVFNRGVQLDGLFFGRLGLFAIAGLLIAAFSYTGKLIDAAR